MTGISTTQQNNKPLLSIITVVYNGAETIEKTIRSVIHQTYPYIEYIIIDGASKDGTQQIIEQYQDKITYWQSKPDKGLYDAMNQGLQRATGEYVWFLNSGDCIIHSQIAENIFSFDATSEVFYGETLLVDSNDVEIGLRRKKTPEKLTWKSFKNGMVVSHQAIIVKRNLAGLYNTNYKFSADFDWALQILKKATNIYNTKTVLIKYLEGGLTKKNIKAGLIERFKIMTNHFGFITTVLMHIPISIKFVIYFLRHERF